MYLVAINNLGKVIDNNYYGFEEFYELYNDGIFGNDFAQAQLFDAAAEADEFIQHNQ